MSGAKRRILQDEIEEADSTEIAESSESNDSESFKKDGEGNTYFELTSTRRVTIKKWQGKVLVDIREFYSDPTGEQKPGKKGISLSIEQFEAIKELFPKIAKVISTMK
jgi:hypothetical protein